MKTKIKEIQSILKNRKRHQKGQALVIVLSLLLLCSLVITSTLTFVGTSLKTNKTYIDNTNALYAAEAGIQDGIWQMLNKTTGDLQTFLSTVTNNPNVTPPDNPYPTALFSDYDFNPYGWQYQLKDTSGNNASINSFPVTVSLTNTWVPLIDVNPSTGNSVGWIANVSSLLPPDGTITPPSSAQATNIINNTKLVVSGGVYNVPIYKINVTYSGTSPAFPVLSIGAWLPQGFSYNNGSSNLKDHTTSAWLYSTEQVVKCAGNEAVIWTFTSKTFSSLLASMGQSGSNLAIQFNYTTNLSKLPDCVSWITNNTISDFPYTYTWDADVKVHDMISSAGTNTEIEAFIPKSETRSLGNAMSGDYVATGNSLLTATSYNSNDVRTNLLSHSSATVTVGTGSGQIPSDADLQGAYLYWTGWYDNVSTIPSGSVVFPLVNFKVNNIPVNFNSSGQPISGASVTTGLASTRNQYKWNGPTGRGCSYSCYRDVTALIRKVLKDASPSASNFPGAAQYDVGPATGSIMANTGGTYQEWAYAGWSLILIYSGPSTLGHQLYLYDTFVYADNVKDIDITGNTSGPGGTISGFIVPAQVSGDTEAAKLTACIGDGDYCYDSDFIAVNAPSTYWSNPWSIPVNSVYRLWDGVTLGSPYNNTNTSTNKNNVWNSTSQTGLTEGIDIKTFHILWTDGLIHAGDTSARIDVPTSTDSWSFIYMVLSFRSSVTSGGSISYLIRKKVIP
jgi:hypothetical protein